MLPGFPDLFEAILYTFPRYIFFIFQTFNLYRTWSNQKRLVAVGILGALFPALISLVFIIGWLQGWTQPPAGQ
jgi:Kef-type K+ transport system membrane component KefB